VVSVRGYYLVMTVLRMRVGTTQETEAVESEWGRAGRGRWFVKGGGVPQGLLLTG
jgi:hypothetical protein